MKSLIRLNSFSLLMIFSFASVNAFAQPKKTRYLPEKVKAAAVRDIGWDAHLSLGASASLSSSHKVLGQADGETYTLTFQLNSGLDYINGDHEWRNTFKMAQTVARTPAIDDFIKTSDIIAFESLYLWMIPSARWMGPFARFQLNTSMFPTYDVRAGDVSYVAKDGSPVRFADKLRIGGPFEPLTLKETLGMFARPIKRKDLSVEFKAGFMARQTFVRGNDNYVVDDDDKTPEVEVTILDNAYQAGPSLGVLAKGMTYGNKITYYFDAETMLPVVNDYDGPLNTAELTNIAIEAGLSVKVFAWMSVDYVFRFIREPQLLDANQVQNNVLLTFTYTVAKSAQEKAKK